MKKPLLLALIALFTFASSTAAFSKAGYDKPPQNILDVLHAPSPPSPYVSPTHDTLLLVTPQDYPSLARVAAPFLRLAGVRVEPKNHSRHDTPGGYGIPLCATDYQIVRIADGSITPVSLPKKVCAGAPLWTADGKTFAFTNTTEEAVELWLGDASSGKVHRIPHVKLNPIFGDTVKWMADQKTLLVKLVPEHSTHQPTRQPPLELDYLSGPSIQETHGEKGQSSTYEARDTLTNTRGEELFDYYGNSQLALIDATHGTVKPLGKPGIYDEVKAAPDGNHILVSSIQRPYSYLVTYERFPHQFDIWNRKGTVIHKLVSRPLADRVPIHGVPTGPRGFSWRSTEPATLTWAEALDGGDWKIEAPMRDKVMLLKAPFTSAPVEVTRVQQRFAGLAWGEHSDSAFLYEYDENRHWRRTFLMNVDQPNPRPRMIVNLSYDEHYADPGALVMRQLSNGEWVVQQDADFVYFSGVGSSPSGDRPFLDRMNLKTLLSERLFRSAPTAYEQFESFAGIGERSSSFITWHQSPIDPPNSFLRKLGAVVPGALAGEANYTSSVQALTHIPDPAPAVRAIKKRIVKYKRHDGLDLSFTLYTPPGYKEGVRVPTILYAYPLDYAQTSTAGQVTGSQEMFTRLRKYQFLLLAGYAIIDKASFPIVGDPKKAYDTYLEQLVADAKAAVDKAVEIGVADPARIGVTGHSHGALMTANLIAHSDLFRAGVATSGSYNKTLTPFGFQNERRSVWEAPNVYQQVSTFFAADQIKKPLLIVHGMDDANPGTTPLQATKLYEAIRGNGGIARLVMLPHEPHWYTAMESNEQLIYETLRWFDLYLRNDR